MENPIYLIINSGESSHQENPGTIASNKTIEGSASAENGNGYFGIVRSSRPGLFSSL
jgi:hypothetical protein